VYGALPGASSWPRGSGPAGPGGGAGTAVVADVREMAAGGNTRDAAARLSAGGCHVGHTTKGPCSWSGTVRGVLGRTLDDT
jgi:hypothetical protein